jgi:hypothetical protein
LNDDELLFLKDGNVFRQRADGIGEAELVVDHDVGFQFGEIGPSGEWLVLQSSGLDRREIWAMHLDRDEEPRMLIESPGFFLWKPTLSPDGRWLAYFSSQSGRNEVEVRSFPDVDRYRAVVSTGGGINPRWAPQGHVLYYFDQGRRLVSADLDLSGAPRVRERRPLHTVAPSFLVHQARTATRMTHDGRMVMIESIPELVVLVGSEPLSRQGQSRD